jgi:hypothetical protein
MKKGKILAGGFISLVFTMAVLGACSSGPKAFEDTGPIMPDAQSVVVYFRGGDGYGAIWDGDKPVGNFNEKKIPFIPIIVYKTTPGEHYFIAHASNWIVMRARLEPNKRYFVHITPTPSPPFTTFVAMYPIGGDAGEESLNSKWTRIIAFTDEWRVGFAQGEQLREVQEKLQEAKSKQMEVDLSGEHGI